MVVGIFGKKIKYLKKYTWKVNAKELLLLKKKQFEYNTITDSEKGMDFYDSCMMTKLKSDTNCIIYRYQI